MTDEKTIQPPRGAAKAARDAIKGDGTYDAIVIGGGLGGLAAGALSAKRGKKILLLERHDKFGGAATAYKRKQLEMEVGLHEMDGFDAGDMKWRLWRELGLEDLIERVSVPEFYAVQKAGETDTFIMPEGWDPAIQAITHAFPGETRGIRTYFKILKRIRNALHAFAGAKKTGLWMATQFPIKCWPLVRYNKMTVGAFLDRTFGDNEDIKLMLAANIGYFTHDPSRLSLVYYAIAQGSYHEGGGHYIKGGSQALSDALVGIIRAAGGEALIRRKVTKIETDGGRITGVAHEKMLTIGKRRDPRDAELRTASTSLVFGNAAPDVLAGMLPKDLGEALMAPHRDLPVSTSLFTLFIGLDRRAKDFGVPAYSTFVWPEGAKNFQAYADGQKALAKPASPENVPGFVFVDYGRLESGMNDQGRYFAAICGVDHIDNWQHFTDNEYYAHKADWEAELINALDRQFPGIGGAVVHRELGTARTMREYLNTPEGAIYGYHKEAPFIGKSPPTARTAVPGLYLASAFGSHGGGFTGALLSGEKAARTAWRDAEKTG